MANEGEDNSHVEVIVPARLISLRRPSVRSLADLSRHLDSGAEDESSSIGLSPTKRKLCSDLFSTDDESSMNKKKLCVKTEQVTCEEYRPWHRLPQPVVIQILLYLDKRSRLNMALSCKPWSTLISSACLWRNLYLELTTFKNISKSTLEFCKSHAKHVTRVIITWRRPSYILSSNIHNGINHILTYLKNKAQLRVFRMHYMEMERYWRFEKRRDKLLNNLAKLLRTQKHLKVFVMNGAQIELCQGCVILESAAQNCCQQIEILNLEDFFQGRVAAFRVEKYNQAICKFTNLKHLYLNYNYLNEEILEHFAKQTQLRVLSIKVYKNDPHYHRISSTTWQRLKASNPNLEVNIEFDQTPCFIDIYPILAPQMPLKGLYIWSGYEEEVEWRVGDTLRYLAKYFSKSLESITLEIENMGEVIDRPLMQLIEQCKSLYHVDINAVISTEIVDEICKLQEANKIHLQSLYITITGNPSSSVQDKLDELTLTYSNLIESHNLDFQFTADVVISSDYAIDTAIEVVVPEIQLERVDVVNHDPQ